jgi:hypothetical protein
MESDPEAKLAELTFLLYQLYREDVHACGMHHKHVRVNHAIL